MTTYLWLSFEFFKIGLFALGGGPATLPFLFDLAERHDWYTVAELTNIIAVSESTPGPIGINMATYAGYHAAGVPGALIATSSLVFPSIVIIILIAKFLAGFSENQTVRGVFYGIRPAVAALIASAVVGLIEACLILPATGQINWKILGLAVLLFLCMRIKKLANLHPVVWLAIAATGGILLRIQ